MSTTGQSPTSVDVVVVGAGVIGLSSAWRLARSGVRVAMIDPHPASAASHAAAGMLAPVSEVTYGEADHLRLAMASLQRFPGFVAELEADSDSEVGLRQDGTIIVANDAGDRAMLAELHAFQTALGLTARLVGSRECRELEQTLSPDVRCGLVVDSDHSVDNRRLCHALQRAAVRAGVAIAVDRVSSLAVDGGRVNGVRCASGEVISASTVLLAAGPWSGSIGGVPREMQSVVRPVKGEIVRLRARSGVPLPRRTVRGIVNGHDVYLVPRADGELVVGATVEEAGFDVTVRAGAVRELLRDARAVLPLIDELELIESMAALRPGSPDNEPSIGPTGLPGLLVATGHYRNGILLAPITADLVLTLVTGTGGVDDHSLIDAVSPRRFDSAGSRR
ncbi:MAG TPA: glycine oxidase ThiO [Mycobacteriales bacterium]|nr:glycine oxidase ThiO [Mycobacteriales bacterium]